MTTHSSPADGRRSVTPVDDVSLEPWSRDATVVLDAASITKSIQADTRARVHRAHRESGAAGDPPAVTFHAASLALHRIVDVLAHHGVRTSRLLIATTLGVFPPESSGWRGIEDAEDAPHLGRLVRTGVERVEHARERLADRGIVVEGLPGLIGAGGESCVDELCVLAAAHASWREEGGDVIVVSNDADVAVAPLLAGSRRIMLARRMDAESARDLRTRQRRHGESDRRTLPGHVRLLGTSLQGLLRAEDLPDDARSGALRRILERCEPVHVPRVAIAEVEGRPVLLNAENVSQVLSSPLDAGPDDAWVRRRAVVSTEHVRSTVVVDPFGLLATANRSDVGGRVPLPGSVSAALASLALPEPVAQLAVVPDLLDVDHGIIAVSADAPGLEVAPQLRPVLTRRVVRSLRLLDGDLEASIDAYDGDDLPETVATASQFARSSLSEFGNPTAALEEKESAVLLAADLLWALLETDGPVVLMTDRPDLVALLDVMAEHFGDALGMDGRVLRVGLHADPFSGTGIPVERSGTVTRWPTMLLTGRMLVDLLRLDPDADTAAGGHAAGPRIVDAITFDPVLGVFTLSDLGGRPLGEIGFEQIVQLPLSTAERIGSTREAGLEELRSRLLSDLHLHLDLGVPRPRPVLAPAARHHGSDVVPASVRSGSVIAGTETSLSVRIVSPTEPTRVFRTPAPAIASRPPVGSEVEVIVADDGTGCAISIPDLSAIPDDVGRPRPARVVASDGDALRVELLEPRDAGDVRDDTGREVDLEPLLGPFAVPTVGDVVMVVRSPLRRDAARAVSTPLSAG